MGSDRLADLADSVRYLVWRIVATLFAGVGGAIADGIVGWIAGLLTEPPADAKAFLDARGIHVAAFAFFGVGTGFVVAVLSILIWALLARWGSSWRQ